MFSAAAHYHKVWKKVQRSKVQEVALEVAELQVQQMLLALCSTLNNRPRKGLKEAMKRTKMGTVTTKSSVNNLRYSSDLATETFFFEGPKNTKPQVCLLRNKLTVMLASRVKGKHMTISLALNLTYQPQDKCSWTDLNIRMKTRSANSDNKWSDKWGKVSRWKKCQAFEWDQLWK